jgi:hypothetical protein
MPFQITDEIYKLLLDENSNTQNLREDIINNLNKNFTISNNSSVEEIANKILEYYKSLCKNKQKNEKYMSMVNNITVNKELYEQSIKNYYKRYIDILNISGGICLIIIAVYKIVYMKQ